MGDQSINLDQRLKTAQDFHRAGNLSEAENIYVELLSHAPKSVDTLRLLGALYLQQGAPYKAMRHLTRALEVAPHQHEARLNLAYALFQAQHYDSALQEIDTVLTHLPTSATAYNHRGLILGGLNRHDDAIAAFNQALQLQPNNFDALINRGNTLQKQGAHGQALTSYQQAVTSAPSSALAHFSLGRALAADGNPERALVHYEQALIAQPHYAEARWAKGVTKLMLGEYLEGWALYEARWQATSFGHAPRNFPQPQWDGTSLSGKTILVHAEQGFGDTIQFCRYVPLLTAQGAKVILLAQPELKSLLQASLPCDVFAPGEKISKFDTHCALLSLPHLMRTTLETIPNATPYLTPPSDKIARWSALLGQKQRLRIGLTWSGRRTHIDDQRRSITLETLRPIFALNAEFHALQTEISDADRKTLAQTQIRRFDLENRDFGDAAAHIAAMDVVISVDTSLAHLAGALNKPTWIMLAYKSDFRWMMSRTDSPWYPTARLFRQLHKNDWADVIACVRTELQKLL